LLSPSQIPIQLFVTVQELSAPQLATSFKRTIKHKGASAPFFIFR
jgi:hypothetical protein